MEAFTGVFRDENRLSEGFVPAKRINYLEHNNDSLLAIIKEHCIDKNQPVVISNMHESPDWDNQIFTLNRLKEYCGDLELAPSHSNNVKKTELLGDYIQTLQKLYSLNPSDQLASSNKRRRDRHSLTEVENSTCQTENAPVADESTIAEEETVPTTPVEPPKPVKQYKTLDYSIGKIYAKDISCPAEYKEAIRKIVPEYLHPHGYNDLFSLLPPRFKAENLMCYLAQNKTGTPMHRDICGTVGHNIMTMASRGGYAEWFIVVNEDRDKLASVLKPVNPLDKEHIENARPNRSVTKSSFMESERGWLRKSHLKISNLTVQVILQQVGDLVIIPSRAYHQVRNVGVTVKVAWNRVTAQTLTNAFEDQLPLYQMVCRPEVFKCKAIVYYTLQHWSTQLNQVTVSEVESVDDLEALKYGRENFIADSKMLLDLYINEVLYPEMLSAEDEKNVIVDVPNEFCTVKCDFCHADVFYHYYECKKCNNYDLCMGCYVAGRSCPHTGNMKMRRSDIDLPNLIDVYENFIDNANHVFGEHIFTDISECLDRSLLKESPNLATICRRLERYRSKAKKNLNIFTCTHCSEEWTIAELAENGISFSSFLKRPMCKKRTKTKIHKDLKVFVCKECTEKCKSCQPLVPSNDSMEDVSLVYYAPPSVDKRNRGAFFDVGVKKSCDYPVISRQRKQKKKNITNEEGALGNESSETAPPTDGIMNDALLEIVEEYRRESLKRRAREKEANQLMRKKNRTTNGSATENVESPARVQSDLQLQLMVEACRAGESLVRPNKRPANYLRSKPKPILPMPSYDDIFRIPRNEFTRANQNSNSQNHNECITISDREDSPQSESTPPPFPKSALELYLEQLHVEKEKSVAQRLIETAQNLVKQPAAAGYVPPLSYYLDDYDDGDDDAYYSD